MFSEKCWVVFIIAFISLIFLYSPYFSPAASYFISRSQHTLITPKLTLQQSLQQLVQSPVVGSLFYEELIVQLASNHQWDKVLEHSERALEGVNSHKFAIWYHKALAECLKGRKADCESSARIASGLLKSTSEHHLSQIYSLIELLDRKSGKFELTKNNEGTTVITYHFEEEIEINEEEQKRKQSNKVPISEL